MSKYTIDIYRIDTILLREGLRNTKPVSHILKKYFTDFRGDKKELRSNIQNALNGNSYEKAIELKLMPIFKRVYKEKTGKEYKRK